MPDDTIGCGEKVSAVIRNTETGKVTRIEHTDTEPRYRVNIRVTDLKTGEVEEIEEYQ